MTQLRYCTAKAQRVSLKVLEEDWVTYTKIAYDRTRTGDLSLTKGMLYQLSYIGVSPSKMQQIHNRKVPQKVSVLINSTSGLGLPAFECDVYESILLRVAGKKIFFFALRLQSRNEAKRVQRVALRKYAQDQVSQYTRHALSLTNALEANGLEPITSCVQSMCSTN